MIRKLLTYLSLTLLLVATGCSDDPIYEAPRGDSSLTLLIPSTVMSRADDDSFYDDHATNSGTVEAAEAKIKDHFYVVGFWGTGTDRKYFKEKLTPEMGISVDDVYRSYTFDVAEGTYDIYIVANVPEMTTKLSGTITNVSSLEDDVKKLVHSYVSGSTVTLPNTADGLPMACHRAVTVAKKSSATVHANLDFLCAKVRLTVIHDETLGKKGLKVTKLGAENLYSPVNCFDAGTSLAYTDNKSLTSGAGSIAHYALTSTLANKTLEELATIPTDGAADPIDFSGATQLTATELANSDANVFQSIGYLPESPEYDSTHPATALIATFASGSESKEIKFPVGCTKNAATPNRITSCDRIERGHFYDIVAKFIGGDVFFSWTVSDWTPESLSIKLAGNTTLWLDQVEIADPDKNEPAVNGEDAYRIPYTTSAPRLTFKSCEANGKPIFDVVENKDEGVLEVSLNSSVTASTTLPPDLGFWVIAGNVQKWVQVKAIDASTFFRISPDDRFLYISQIVNERSYSLVYEYATNMDSFTLNLEDYDNPNTAKEKADIKIAVYTGTYTGTLDGLEPFTQEVRMVSADGVKVRNLKDIPTLTSGAEFPKSGVVVITITEPANQKAFGKKITGSIKGTGTSGSDVKSDHGNFEINPAAQKYIIHFKSIKNDWGDPHVYVYQPLTHYSAEKGKELDVFDTKGSFNWLEYSFTGKVVFKGWKSENGAIEDPKESEIHNVTQAGNTFSAYQVWGEDGSSIGDTEYFTDIDLIADHRAKVTCGDCKNSTKYKKTWPGVQMIYEGDIKNEGDGWYKIELPLLAEPGKALVMFADGHNCGQNDANRYPAHQNPGLPLPNFATCEAWFLYDATKKDLLDFSDYPRTSYAGSGGVVEEDKVVTFRAPKNSSDSKITDKLYMWSSNGNITSGWPGSNKTGEIDGYYYWKFTVSVPKGKTPADIITGYKFVSGNDGTTDDIKWSDNRHKEVTTAATKQKFGNCDYLYTIWAEGNTEPTPGGDGPTNGQELDKFIPGDYRVTFNGDYRLWMWVENGDAISENKGENKDDKGNIYYGQCDFTLTMTSSDSNKHLKIQFSWTNKEKSNTYDVPPSWFKWDSSINKWKCEIGNVSI